MSSWPLIIIVYHPHSSKINFCMQLIIIYHYIVLCYKCYNFHTEEYASSLLGLLVFGLIYLCVKCKAHRLFTTSGCYSCRHECDVPDAFRNASSRNADCCRESRRPCSRWFSRVPRRYTTESQTDNGELPRDMFPGRIGLPYMDKRTFACPF